MDKVKELKQEYIKKYIPKIMHNDNGFPVPSEYYVNALNDFLNEYAQQVSREKDEKILKLENYIIQLK